ncbi:MAG: glycosyltransferase family 4 protein [Candidatus Aquirickettsiella gammari]
MKIDSIHQFSFACSSGSGVTNSMFYVRDMLRAMGFSSDIFSVQIPADLQSEIKPLSALADDAQTLILYHHCLGYDDVGLLLDLRMPKIMVYHNITPPEFLPANSEIARYAVLGREQLRAWPRHFVAAIGDSPLNTQELIDKQYAHSQTLTMLVDLQKMRAIQADTKAWFDLKDSYNLLFVGRICENKRQLELLDVLQHLRHLSVQPVRLILAGEVTSGGYEQQIRERIAQWGMGQQVVLTGKISDPELAGLYRSADAFVCMSVHEGFGMPLIESMLYDLPVIARDSSSIASTMGQGGLLLNANATAHDMAASVLTLMKEPALKRQILQAQRKNIERFSRQHVQSSLRRLLEDLDVAIPNTDSQENHGSVDQARWQIEGPFDSNYSLAIVNRELALALDKRGVSVALRSHEGAGDFMPSRDFLDKNADCERLFAGVETGKADAILDVALRFCYPPYVDDMVAKTRVVHSYGWEETGFPLEYVAAFNRRLDLITVLSTTVEKILRDSGVRVPIAVTGAGVDHLLSVSALPPPKKLSDAWKSFRFLHISSCFPRKGIDVLLAAYSASFSAADDVSLVIKTSPNPHHDIEKELAVLRQTRADFPHVLVEQDDISQGELIGLYQACHAFVAPSRGEGLGLPMAEAMLFDLPVITTAWGGQTDFCNDTTAWCCDYRYAKAQTHLGLTHSLWAEPDQGHLTKLMREIYQLPVEEKNRKTRVARERILREFTWDRTAQNIQHAVAALDQQPLFRNEPKIAWISTWNARCGIANYSHFLTQKIPTQRLCILANHIPERVGIDAENVLRCWNAEQDENFDYALATILEQGIKAVVIQYNFGFSSLTNFATFIRKLKQHQIALYVFFHSTADVPLNGTIASLRKIATELASVERLFVHSVDDVNRLKEFGLIENVIYFPHGVTSPTQTTLLKDVSFSGKTVIASYGFLLPHKGIVQLIEAFSQLDHQARDLHLLLVNSLYPASVSENELHHCRERIAVLGLQNKVSLMTEFLSDQETHRLLANADLIVFPYQQTQESSSAAVRVGLASGKPVAVTPLTIFSDVEEAVFQLPGTSPELIARGIADLLDDSQRYEDKKQEIAQWFAERDWPHLSARLLNLIDGIANPLSAYARNK